MKRLLSLATALTIIAARFTVCLAAPELGNFTSDGCSLFPDGRMQDPAQWCDCCFMHDVAYWRGGSREDRKKADEELRDCVFKRTGNRALAAAMFEAVRAGGHPAFPTWYRWGYGWKYGRGYLVLSDEEWKQVAVRLTDYYSANPDGYCGKKVNRTDDAR